MARITGTRPSANTERVGPHELIEVLEGATVESAVVAHPRGFTELEITLDNGRTVRVREDVPPDVDLGHGLAFRIDHEPYVIDRGQFEALAQPGQRERSRDLLWWDVERHFRGPR